MYGEHPSFDDHLPGPVMSFPRPKALLTDVFGTVVDWRSSVTNHLQQVCAETLSLDRAASLSSKTREIASGFDWPTFAQAWRVAYVHFCHSFTPVPAGSLGFKSIDKHFRDSLEALLKEYDLGELWSKEEMDDISRIWHKLAPWPDSAPGLTKLNDLGFVTATLSNGNTKLLTDLANFGKLPYARILGAEDFGAYKPHEKVYRGAAEMLEAKAEECALLAAHLGDLEAARRCGFRTVYIERENEEGWSKEKAEAARREGWVDMSVSVGEGGFEEVARRFGVESGKDQVKAREIEESDRRMPP
jgi:2-haloacid dehalogenase